jgi:hypothetical protein
MAATYDFTPVNGGDNTVGSIESVAQLDAYLVNVGDGSGGSVDLQGVDGAHGSVYDLILRELQPLMAYAPADTSGNIHIIVDGHANTAASILARLEAIDGVGNDSSVTAASSITIA